MALVKKAVKEKKEIGGNIEDTIKAIQAKFGLPDKALLLNCSHTHCGPELRYTELEFMSFTDPLRKERCLRYNAFLTDKIVSIIGEHGFAFCMQHVAEAGQPVPVLPHDVELTRAGA